MAVGINGDLNAGMPQLLRHALDGGMMLIQLDGRVTMSEIVQAIDT